MTILKFIIFILKTMMGLKNSRKKYKKIYKIVIKFYFFEIKMNVIIYK